MTQKHTDDSDWPASIRIIILLHLNGTVLLVFFILQIQPFLVLVSLFKYHRILFAAKRMSGQLIRLIHTIFGWFGAFQSFHNSTHITSSSFLGFVLYINRLMLGDY